MINNVYRKTYTFGPIYIFFICVIMTPLMHSCTISIFDSKSSSKTSDRYSYRYPNSSWIEIPRDQSDMAIMNREFGTIITASSLCKKYINSSLKNLSSNIYTGVSDIIIIEESELQLFDRKTLRKWITGKLDGINVSILSYTLVKNRCIYDFILIHPQITFPAQVKKDMNQFLDSININ